MHKCDPPAHDCRGRPAHPEVWRPAASSPGALAVSGGYGTTFEPTGRFHHIFDPQTGASANRLADAAVIGPRATTANGLATAICVAGEERAAAMLAACPGTWAILTRPDGTSVTIAPGASVG